MKYNSEATKPTYIFPAGVYPSQVITAEEKVSKKGNPMLVVELDCFDTNGKTKGVTDYIVIGGEHSQDWKLKHLAVACGIPATGDIAAHDLIGRSLRVKLKVEPPKDGFGEQNRVADFLAPEAQAPVERRAPVKPVGGGTPAPLEDPPFVKFDMPV